MSSSWLSPRTREILEKGGAGYVTLVRPYDRIVFERTWQGSGTVNASLAQVSADCLTGPARLPSEGEALLEWMRNNAPRWQAPSLDTKADTP